MITEEGESSLIVVASVACQLCRIASHCIASAVIALRFAPTHLVALLEVCREKVECKTSTVWHELSTDDHLMQKVVCSTSIRSQVARTEGRIAFADHRRCKSKDVEHRVACRDMAGGGLKVVTYHRRVETSP